MSLFKILGHLEKEPEEVCDRQVECSPMHPSQPFHRVLFPPKRRWGVLQIRSCILKRLSFRILTRAVHISFQKKKILLIRSIANQAIQTWIRLRFQPLQKLNRNIALKDSVVDPYSFFPDPDPDPEFDVGYQYESGSGFRIRIRIKYGSRALMTKN